jgi:hypothetical protein
VTEAQEQQEERDPTEIPEDDPSQQSPERDRVEQERKLSTPEMAEGGEAGQEEPQSEEAKEEQQQVQEVQQERQKAAKEGRAPKS